MRSPAAMEKEEQDTILAADDLSPRPNPNPNPTYDKPTAPEVEVHLYRQGRGPIEVFRSRLGGWDQDRLEVHDILERHGFKSLYAFNPASGRGVPIRFSPRNGRSFLPYSHGAVIHVDGEPKDSLVKPVTKILVGVAVLTLLIALYLKEAPEWLNLSRITGANFPPWMLACVVIVFARLRKGTKDVLKKYGW